MIHNQIVTKTYRQAHHFEVENQIVTKTYQQVHFEVEEEIKKLQIALDRHNAQVANVDWMHVGDIECVLEKLKKINEGGI